MFDKTLKALMVVGILIAVSLLPTNPGGEPLRLQSNPNVPSPTDVKYTQYLKMVPFARSLNLDHATRDLSSDACPLDSSIREYYGATGIEAPKKALDKLRSDACAVPLQLQIPVAQIIYAIVEAGDLQQAHIDAVGPVKLKELQDALKDGGLDTNHPELVSATMPVIDVLDQTASIKAAYAVLSAIEEAKPLLLEYQLSLQLGGGGKKSSQGGGNGAGDGSGSDSTSDLLDGADDIVGHQFSSGNGVLFADPTGLFIIGDVTPATYVGAWNPSVDVPTVNQAITNVLTVDLGGDDTYYGRAGGANGLPTQLGGDGVPVSVVIDLGGNDHYEGPTVCQGAGDSAIGILIDTEGNDRYVGGAGGICQGSGRFAGVGVMIDEAGSDYRSSGTQSQGAAFFRGIGIMVDLAGSDENWATSASQGFAWGGYGVSDQRSVGIHVDYGGNDFYNLTVCCGRGYTAGGSASGWFIDKGGIDVYQMVGLANGAAWDSGGDALFLDEGSDIDSYESPSYNCPCGNDKTWTQGPAGGRGIDGPKIT